MIARRLRRFFTKRKREKEKSNIIFLNEISFVIPPQAGIQTSSNKVTAF